MLFVGVDPDEASAATRAEARNQPDPEVPALASARTSLFRTLRGRFRRWFR
jgi:hypothetical protein